MKCGIRAQPQQFWSFPSAIIWPSGPFTVLISVVSVRFSGSLQVKAKPSNLGGMLMSCVDTEAYHNNHRMSAVHVSTEYERLLPLCGWLITLSLCHYQSPDSEQRRLQLCGGKLIKHAGEMRLQTPLESGRRCDTSVSRAFGDAAFKVGWL